MATQPKKLLEAIALSKLSQIIGSTEERSLKGGVLVKKNVANSSKCQEASPSTSSPVERNCQ